jgi:hypothetical protein
MFDRRRTTLSLVSSECFAQSHSPYAGLETRAIKALSDQQIADLALFAAMTAESIAIGEKLIAQETALDHRFANKTITPAGLTTLVEAIGNTQATLRATHLKYHLLTLEILTPAQARRYSELRGYGSASAHNPSRHQLEPGNR